MVSCSPTPQENTREIVCFLASGVRTEYNPQICLLLWIMIP